MELAQCYVDTDAASYRSCTRGGLAGRKGYQRQDGEHLAGDNALHHSTLWQAISWLGSLEASLHCAMDLVLHRDPTSKVHRQCGGIAAGKFRSAEREKQLRTTRRLLNVMAEFQRLFNRPFFPRFATAAGGG